MKPPPATISSRSRTHVSPGKRFLLYSLLLLVIFFCTLSGVFYLFIEINMEHELKTNLLHESAELNSASKIITLLFEMKFSDMMVLAEGETMRKFLHDDNMTNRVHLTREFMLLARRKPYYTHIRFLDADGNEQIWIDNSTGIQAIVPRAELQNKRDRYYFEQAMNLPEGDIYISPMDIKVDTEKPSTLLEPTIRLATPVFDGYGEKRGVLVFNYSPNELLDRVKSFSNPLLGESIILNPDGYWLTGAPDEKRMGFLLEKGASFEKEKPDIWNTVAHNEHGTVSGEDGVYVYQKSYLFHRESIEVPDKLALASFTTEPHVNDPYWILISRISNAKLEQIKTERSAVAGAIYLSLFFLSGLISYTFAKILVQKQQTTMLLRERAVTDDLTGAMNRRELDKVGKREFERAKRFQRDFSIMMIDLDHFKSVNDTFGHDLGDRVLRHVSIIFQSTIRLQDTLARYGGEEFVVLMPETDINGASQLAERICTNVSLQPYQHIGGEIDMTVSIGISSYTASDKEYTDILLRSDKALYQAKARGRNRFEVNVSEHKPTQRAPRDSH